MEWYKITNKADKAEIWIYEMIGEDFWSDSGVTAKGFQKDLAKITASGIDLHINSPGGEVFDGITIYNLIKNHPAKVTTYIDGVAASIASVIALAGDEVLMAENALMMIHNPYGMAAGDSKEMRKMADVLDVVGGSIAKAYISKTDKTEDEIQALMDAETWMTADEAIELGFVDEVTEKMDMAASAKFAPIMAKAGFKNVPEIINAKDVPTAKDADKALRDAGFSRKQTKMVLAKGISEYLRNVDVPEPEQVDEPQRDVEDKPPVKKDRVADLLTRAELVAPSAI